MDKSQKEARRRQEDMALNRGLIWVGAAIVLELLLLLINKYYVDLYTTAQSINLAMALRTGMRAVRIIGLAGVFVCGGWIWLSLKSRSSVTVPFIFLTACGVLSFCCHIIVTFYSTGLRMLFLLVPGWAALALVYYLYQREFFFSAFVCGLGVVALWLVRHRNDSPVTLYVFLVLVAAVLVAGGVLMNCLRRNEGELSLLGQKLRILPKDAGYAVLLATAAVNAAVAVLALAMGPTAAYYLMYVLVAWLFGLLVYYTVKMM